jgi:hypothetical protein
MHIGETDCVADDTVDVEPVSPVLPCLTLLSPNSLSFCDHRLSIPL